MNNEIVGWGFDKKLTHLPLNIAFSFGKIGFILNLEGTDIDMIPRGLKGIDVVNFGPVKGPLFVAPDFQGMVFYQENTDGKYLDTKMMTPAEIMAAKKLYLKYKSFVESPRFVNKIDRGDNPSLFWPAGCVLPNNMRFYFKNRTTYLDLSKTTINQKPQILGVDHVIMPSHKINRHRGVQMVHSKPQICR